VPPTVENQWFVGLVTLALQLDQNLKRKKRKSRSDATADLIPDRSFVTGSRSTAHRATLAGRRVRPGCRAALRGQAADGATASRRPHCREVAVATCAGYGEARRPRWSCRRALGMAERAFVEFTFDTSKRTTTLALPSTPKRSTREDSQSCRETSARPRTRAVGEARQVRLSGFLVLLTLSWLGNRRSRQPSPSRSRT